MLVRVIPVRSGSLAHTIGRAIPFRDSEADGIRANIVLRPNAVFDFLIVRRPKPQILRKCAALSLVHGCVVIAPYKPFRVVWRKLLPEPYLISSSISRNDMSALSH